MAVGSLWNRKLSNQYFYLVLKDLRGSILKPNTKKHWFDNLFWKLTHLEENWSEKKHDLFEVWIIGMVWRLIQWCDVWGSHWGWDKQWYWRCCPCSTLYPVFRGGMLVTPYLSLYTWDIEVFVLAGLLAGRGDLPGGGLLSGLTAWDQDWGNIKLMAPLKILPSSEKQFFP